MPYAFNLMEYFTTSQNIDFLIRIIVACFCGALIGYERSRRFIDAGVRTHLIVCCAAASLMIVSKYGFVDLVAKNGDLLYGTRGTDLPGSQRRLSAVSVFSEPVRSSATKIL